VIGKLLDQTNENMGYDASEDKYIDMFEKGIIDPTKVVRRALIDASSVAGLMVTTECMVVDAKEDSKPMPGGMGGGMGGMGGMGGGDMY